jgi:demethylmenaquinone methyltransferase/2-methoxy-6-polyprenyl-1,4-benzoquinol methylase
LPFTLIVPASQVDVKPPAVRAMFGRIAARYDLMNSLMTLGLDAAWRRAAVQEAKPPPEGLALDVGTGTARLAAVLAGAMPAGRVVGLDLTLPMLRAGQAWLWAREEGERVALVVGDALRLPFADSSFDCLASAFTVRNLADLGQGFREQARVLKPGGSVVCLELTWPRSPFVRAVFSMYFRGLVPVLGRLIAGDRSAYTYLPDSVRAFPGAEAIAQTMGEAGLADVRWRYLGLGTVTLHLGKRAR